MRAIPSSLAYFSPPFWNRGALATLVLQCEAIQTWSLPFLAQRGLKTWFSLGQPDLWRQREWSVLTRNLTGIDVFVKCWAVSFNHYFLTLCCGTLFLFLNSLPACCRYLGEILLYVFCNKIWYKVISFLWSLIKSFSFYHRGFISF